MDVRTVCTKPAVTCSPDTQLQEAAEIMRAHNVGCLVVVRHDVMVGVVTDRDLVTRGIAGGLTLSATVEQVMSTEVACVFENDDVELAATILAQRGLRRLPVLSVHSTVQGMLSLDDLTIFFADQISRLAYAVRGDQHRVAVG